MTDRPEWVKCVLLPEDNALTWCARQLEPAEFAFTSIDHAALNGKHGGRLVACSGCVRLIIGALSRGIAVD